MNLDNNETLHNVAILCCGGSLKYLDLLKNDKIDYVILVNYFWSSSNINNNSREPLWKKKCVYEFLKNKKIILWTRDLDGDIKSLIDNLNVIKCYYSIWSTSLLNDYKWINNYKDPYLIKKLRLTSKSRWSSNGKVFEVIPNKLFEHCAEDIIFFVESVKEFEKTNYKDNTKFKMWLSTFGHAMDYSIVYLNPKKIYIVGWDLYEGGSINNQHQYANIKDPIIFRGCNIRDEWINGSKSCLLKKIKNNPTIDFELLTYINFEENIPSQYTKGENHNLNSLKNLKIKSF
jgi:hypothetical protein